MFQVSIMQIASEKMVFIFDLIKLFEDMPHMLDDCMTHILQSPRILKLGMINLIHTLGFIDLWSLAQMTVFERSYPPMTSKALYEYVYL